MRRTLLIGLGLLIASLHFAAAAQTMSVERILGLIASAPKTPARFHEFKSFKQLGTTVESNGELFIEGEGSLVKRTQDPIKETMRLSATRMSIESRGRTQSLQLADRPEVQAIALGLRSAILGEHTGLLTHFDTKPSGPAARWQLRLTPKNAAVQRILSEILISGYQHEVHRIETRFANGDLSMLTVLR